LVWRRAIAARKFLKNQGFPVFQKLWRFSVQCQLNATWYESLSPEADLQKIFRLVQAWFVLLLSLIDIFFS
jgi:hypothetical protein